MLGQIVDEEMILSEAGKTIDFWWREIQNKFQNVQLDTYMVMPNHLHGIINILETNRNSEGVGADLRVRQSAALPEIIKWFKTMTTNDYIRGVKQKKWPSFDKHLWQRSYYEHVIRRLEDIDKVRHYILENPIRWELSWQDKAKQRHSGD